MYSTDIDYRHLRNGEIIQPGDEIYDHDQYPPEWVEIGTEHQGHKYRADVMRAVRRKQAVTLAQS